MRALASSLVAALCLVGCSADEDAPPRDDANVFVPQAGTTPPPMAGTTPPPMAGTAPPPMAGTVAPPIAGTVALPVAGMNVPMAGTGGEAGMMGIDMETDDIAMDECGLDTGFPGDEYCINPPPPDKGFQMHIGPSNYDNPEREYVLEPGDERTENFDEVSGNTTDVFYYWRQYRMRPGSHHLIVNAGTRRLGGTTNSAKDNPHKGEIAPENQGVGMPLGARTPLSNSYHTFNFTNMPVIKEAWVNFWYRDPSEVTEAASEVFSMYVPMNVAPGEHVVLSGSCPVSGSGRALTFYGHVHANNERFSVWHVRGGQRTLVYENYDWEHPVVVEYSSLVTNPMPDAVTETPGGLSGVLDLRQGDEIYFECQVINMTNSVFRGANEAMDDEMCILIGDTAGASIPPLCSYQKRDI